VLAREGGVFVDPDHLPLRSLDVLVASIGAFCSTVASHGASRPHMLSPSVLGATRNHPMLWHAIRDLPHSVLVYRGVWDQSGPGFLTLGPRPRALPRSRAVPLDALRTK